jgi:hypothetical protein
VLSKPQSPHKAPSTVGDFDSISAPVEEQRTPPPPSFDSGATLDAWAHEEFDEEMAQLEVAKQATPKPAPPVVPQKRATPATAARIERPGAEVGPSGGSSMLRMLGVALVLGTLVGGGLVMVGGIASVIFIFLR